MELQSLSKKRRAKKNTTASAAPNENSDLGRGKRVKQATERRLAQRSNYLHEKADAFLELLDLPRHWQPDDPECIAARKMYSERRLMQAIDKLEALVVRRLFELQKCHVSGTSKCKDYMRIYRLTKECEIIKCGSIS